MLIFLTGSFDFHHIYKLSFKKLDVINNKIYNKKKTENKNNNKDNKQNNVKRDVKELRAKR